MSHWPPQHTTRLSDADWSAQCEANRLLTQITAGHHHTCECWLCEARILTDVQDGEKARLVTYTPECGGAN